MHRASVVPRTRYLQASDADDVARSGVASIGGGAGAFHARVALLFTEHFPRLTRLLCRLTGEPDLSADLAQDAFVRLYRRGSLPDAPAAWLATVALNLLRNSATSRRRRRELLHVGRGERVHSDPPPSPDDAVASGELSHRVRATLARLDERERRLLVLRSEGYSYREIAVALGLNETSVGTLLARACRAFRETYEGATDAP
jgi:RNA polymerase sigma factor (sigma-70 family)